MKCKFLNKRRRGNLVVIMAATGAILMLAATLTLQITTKAKMGVSLREDKKYDVDLDSSVELAKNMFMSYLEDDMVDIRYKGNQQTLETGLVYLDTPETYFPDIFAEAGVTPYISHTSGGKTKMLDTMDSNLVLASTQLNMDVDSATSSATFIGTSLPVYNLLTLFNINNPNTISSGSEVGMKTTTQIPAIEFEVRVENQNRTLVTKYTVLGINIVREIIKVAGNGPDRVIDARLTVDLSSTKFNLTDIQLIQNVAQTTYSAPAVFNNMGTLMMSATEYNGSGSSTGTGTETAVSTNIRNEILTQCVAYSGYPYKMIHDEGCMSDPPQYLDCSAYVWKVYTKAGLQTPLLSTRQMVTSSTWVWIPFSQIQPGDILIGVGNDRHHTMVYIGYEDGQHYVFEASNPSKLSGISTYSGNTFDMDAIVRPADINNNLYYAYRHVNLF